MKLVKEKQWKVLAGMVCFLVIAKLLFSSLFVLFEPGINDITFKITERPAVIPTSWLFSFEMAFIPLLLMFLWKAGEITSPVKRILSVFIILCCIAFAIFLRHEAVKAYFTTIVRPYLQSRGELPIVYPIDPAHFVYNIFYGLVTGCIISFFILKKRVASST